MSAYHIYGLSGSGKTTVGNVLKERGFNVINTDSLSSWFGKDAEDKINQEPPHPLTSEWLTSHKWLWDKDKITEILSTTGQGPIFFCGGADNEAEFYSSFKKRFALLTDDETLESRLKSREPERWVEGSPELTRMLEWNKGFKAYCLSSGSTLIDGSESPDKVADTILSHL